VTLTVVQRNAQVVREAFERWGADDFISVVELYTPDITMDTNGVIVAAGVHRGRQDVTDALVELASKQPERSLRRLELEENGDWVLALAEFSDGFCHAGLFRLRDCLIAQIETAPNADEGRRALRALGAGEAAEPLWARIGAAEFVVGHMEVASSSAALCLEGRRILTTLPSALVDRVSTGDPVLAYLDAEGGLLGWYLPDQQLGVDLRIGSASA
jgi:hypothetical protein